MPIAKPKADGRDERLAKRPVVHCLIPPDLAPRLHDLLRDHFRDDPGVEVLVERRGRERRSGEEQRQSDREVALERRETRAVNGRRIGERRAELVPVAEAPPLPRRARRHAERIAFVVRREPAGQRAEDLDTARLVTRFQAGDSEAFGDLYSRYFDRVYSYLKLLLRDPHEAEDATQEVFTNAFEALPRYERRKQPFRAWLFTIVRNHGIEVLRRQGRLDLMDPVELARRVESEALSEAGLEILDWISDRDLSLFVERLPLPQRQVLVLRFVLDMPGEEIAAVLGRTPGDVRKLQSRAVEYLRERLTAIGRKPATKRSDRPVVRVDRQAPVLRSRRFSL